MNTQTRWIGWPVGGLPTQSHTVYRYYDALGRLLYVGSTNDGLRRDREHQAQPWWDQVATSEIAHFASRDAAREAEQAALDDERPAFNQYRALGKTPMRSMRIPDDIWEPAKAKAAEEGVTVTDVVRRALIDYAGGES